MNIESEAGSIIIARTCGCKDRGQRVSYSFVDQVHALCLDRKDIIIAEIEACERLLKYAADESERKAIETEISELQMTLDLLT
jgi:hypothetical protein